MEHIGYLEEEVTLQETPVTYVTPAKTKAKKKKQKPSPIYPAAKRLMDIGGAIVAQIFLAIPMLVVALLVFLQDFHNPIFKQTRVTKDGRRFTMYKFRTMCVNAEEMLDSLQDQNEADGPLFKMEHDPRVTPLGEFLRKTSIDELPQLWNVLGGSMSLVGPRPPLPREVEQYTPEQLHRLDVKGGITCYWQCSGRSNIPFAKQVEMDCQYIKERCIKTDIQIIFRTFGAVVHRNGAM